MQIYKLFSSCNFVRLCSAKLQKFCTLFLPHFFRHSTKQTNRQQQQPTTAKIKYFVLWSIFGSLKSCNNMQRTERNVKRAEKGQKSLKMFLIIKYTSTPPRYAHTHILVAFSQNFFGRKIFFSYFFGIGIFIFFLNFYIS
jgi:hypothetical protein